MPISKKRFLVGALKIALIASANDACSLFGRPWALRASMPGDPRHGVTGGAEDQEDERREPANGGRRAFQSIHQQVQRHAHQSEQDELQDVQGQPPSGRRDECSGHVVVG